MPSLLPNTPNLLHRALQTPPPEPVRPQQKPSLPTPRKTLTLPRQRERMMHITVERNEVTHLREVVMQSCGHCVCFMRMSPLDHAQRMQLCLCVEAGAVTMVMDAVMWALPQAEFGLRQAES